jgi:excisionase family DNA binding protein
MFGLVMRGRNPFGTVLEPLFTLTEACAYLRCRKSHLYTLMERGELNWSQVGRKRLIPESDLRMYVERGRDGANRARRPVRGLRVNGVGKG